MRSRLFRIGRAATGLGLFATKPIKRAAYIATYRGRRISSEEANHSCRPNAKPVVSAECKACRLQGRNRYIEPGEEFTYNYGREYLESFLDNGRCRCAACRKKKAIQSRRTHPRGKRKRQKTPAQRR
jgi:uncharacterized protein